MSQVKEIFEDFYKLEMEKKQLLRQMEELRESMTCIGSSSDFSKIRVKTSPPEGARYEELMFKLEEKRAELVKKIMQLEEKQKQIELLIESLENPSERVVMRYRYILGLKFEDIAKEMDYSVQHVYYIHKEAIEKIRVNKSK
ncbi:MAG: DUF1492 domain-containing protein [Lachnospiraceae bacterium]|nr:DUF1492 domain-containing protein [Lachnospiraceae bacterium]